jgi:hypothetical protein
VVLGYSRLSLDGKRIVVRFTRLGSKVYDSCLLSFKGRSASLMIASILSRLLCAVDPVTHAVKSSTKATPPWLSICLCTRSALKKRNRIGDRGEPCGSPACGRLWSSDYCTLVWMFAVRSEQNASTHRSRKVSNDPDVPGNDIARNGVQCYSRPRNDAKQGYRSHASDFYSKSERVSEASTETPILSSSQLTRERIPDGLEYREAVHWPDDGKLFLIAVESIFPADLLPILSTKSYLSPIRRLYLHRFYNPMASTITIISFVVSRVPYEGPGDEPQPFAPFASS